LDLQAVEDGAALPVGVTVKEIMDTWTLQAGFPLVKVSIAAADRIFISQVNLTDLLNIIQFVPFVISIFMRYFRNDFSRLQEAMT